MDDSRQPAFDEKPVRIAGATDPRRLYAVIAVLLAVIVVLLIRPWGGESGREPPSVVAGVATTIEAASPAGSATDASTAAPSGSQDAEDVLDVTCGSPSGWRAATLQQWEDRTLPIRSWIAIDPVPATGPLDPGIPFAPVSTGIVTAIGYCAPLDDVRRPPAVATAALWAIRDGQPVELTPLLLEPAEPNALGGLWQRPPEVGPGGPTTAPGPGGDRVWPPGRYVIRVADPAGDYARWLGIEIEDLSARRPSPAPSTLVATPSPSES